MCSLAGRNNHLLFALHAFRLWNCKRDIIYRSSNVHRACLFTHKQCAIRTTKQNKTSSRRKKALFNGEEKKVNTQHSNNNNGSGSMNQLILEHMSPIWHTYDGLWMSFRIKCVCSLDIWSAFHHEMLSKLHDWDRSIDRSIDQIESMLADWLASHHVKLISND